MLPFHTFFWHGVLSYVHVQETWLPFTACVQMYFKEGTRDIGREDDSLCAAILEAHESFIFKCMLPPCEM